MKAVYHAAFRQPQQHLPHYHGINGVLQADAFGGYDRLFSAERNGGPLTEAACWAHARRKIHDVYIYIYTQTATAEEALKRRLFRVLSVASQTAQLHMQPGIVFYHCHQQRADICLPFTQLTKKLNCRRLRRREAQCLAHSLCQQAQPLQSRDKVAASGACTDGGICFASASCFSSCAMVDCYAFSSAAYACIAFCWVAMAGGASLVAVGFFASVTPRTGILPCADLDLGAASEAALSAGYFPDAVSAGGRAYHYFQQTEAGREYHHPRKRHRHTAVEAAQPAGGAS